MYTIDPAPGAFSKALETIPADTPIVMINILKFNDQAQYQTAEDEPCSGREAYGRYSKEAFKHLQTVDARVIWAGAAQWSVIAPAEEEWDEILMVKYPSIQKFVEMVMNPEYQALARHRTAALQNARLIATIEHSGKNA